MKMLAVEDNPVVLDAIMAVFPPGTVQMSSSKTLRDGIVQASSGRYDVVIVDSALEGRTGLRLLDEVTISEEVGRSFFRRRKKDPAIVVIRHIGDVVPTDNPLLKGELTFPFTTEDLRNAVAQALPENTARLSGLIAAPDGVASMADLSRIGVATGKAYLFYNEKPTIIRDVAQLSSSAGFTAFLITASRPKVAKERMGLDLEANVFLLQGENPPLGTMVQAVADYVEANPKQMVIIDDLDLIIERCGIGRTLRALSEILAGENQGKFTFITAVNSGARSESVKNLLCQLMNLYNNEAYYGKNPEGQGKRSA